MAVSVWSSSAMRIVGILDPPGSASLNYAEGGRRKAEGAYSRLPPSVFRLFPARAARSSHSLVSRGRWPSTDRLPGAALMNEETGEPVGVQEGRTRFHAQDTAHLGSHLRLRARRRTDAHRP